MHSVRKRSTKWEKKPASHQMALTEIQSSNMSRTPGKYDARYAFNLKMVNRSLHSQRGNLDCFGLRLCIVLAGRHETMKLEESSNVRFAVHGCPEEGGE
ncbi:hypothetical protein VNI00_019322 [Paramarasmius palmivorus]|uniref:Uncharacterized protein n=1 Tax=Paramarasmius palmivorus TaxID=297713 RepID=A0AAW0ANM3_9AGAR